MLAAVLLGCGSLSHQQARVVAECSYATVCAAGMKAAGMGGQEACRCTPVPCVAWKVRRKPGSVAKSVNASRAAFRGSSILAGLSDLALMHVHFVNPPG